MRTKKEMEYEIKEFNELGQMQLMNEILIDIRDLLSLLQQEYYSVNKYDILRSK